MGRDLKLSQITTPRGLDKAGYVRDAPILDLAGFQTLPVCWRLRLDINALFFGISIRANIDNMIATATDLGKTPYTVDAITRSFVLDIISLFELIESILAEDCRHYIVRISIMSVDNRCAIIPCIDHIVNTETLVLPQATVANGQCRALLTIILRVIRMITKKHTKGILSCQITHLCTITSQAPTRHAFLVFLKIVILSTMTRSPFT